jgi:hypothetical protein
MITIQSHQSIVCIYKRCNCKATISLPTIQTFKVHQDKKWRRRDIKFTINSQNKMTIALGWIGFEKFIDL